MEAKASQRLLPNRRLVPSRDRKGADTCVRSKLFCNEQSHGFALPLDYVPDSRPDLLVLP